MIYDVNDPACRDMRGIVYNADTGERIPHVYHFNDETGEYWQYSTDDEGKIQLNEAKTDVLRQRGRVRLLVFVPFDENGQAPLTPQDPQIASLRARFDAQYCGPEKHPERNKPIIMPRGVVMRTGYDVCHINISEAVDRARWRGIMIGLAVAFVGTIIYKLLAG